MTFARNLKQAYSELSQDDAFTLSAAVAYYAALSLAPLVLLLLTLVSFLGLDIQDRLVEQATNTLGKQGGDVVRSVVRNAGEQPAAATVSAVLGFLVLAFSATGIFVQLQAAMNRIWDVRVRPDAGLWQSVRKRFVSLGMVLVVALLLLASMLLNALLNLLLGSQGILWNIINFFLSLGVFVLLFAAVFKFLPDVRLAWSDVWRGAAITAVLFALGKYGLGVYLGTTSVGSAYGAAGSLILFLIWVYYSSLIVFYGAEVTQVEARQRGQGIEPEAYAERVEETAVSAPEERRKTA